MQKYLDFSFAAPEKFAKRAHDIPAHEIRTAFMRDRDRILFSKAFRRLSGKTQVFVSNFDEHTRSRLTHTLEVSQFSRLIADFLNLDVNLTEAIALGHDIGHTPFGHVGEQTLNLIMNECHIFSEWHKENQDGHFPILPADKQGFKHNHQSVRVLSNLERYYRKKPGLNLTNYTLWGIREHTNLEWKSCEYFDDTKKQCYRNPLPMPCPKPVSLKYYDQYNKYFEIDPNHKTSWSFEAFVVKNCDEIAQRHSDLEDGLETGILTDSIVIHAIENIFKKFIEPNSADDENFRNCKRSINKKEFMPDLSRFIVNFYLKHLRENSLANLKNFAKSNSLDPQKKWEDYYLNFDVEKTRGCVDFAKDFAECDRKFHDFLKESILNSFQVQRMDGYGTFIIKKLFRAFLMNPQQLPNSIIYQLYKNYKPQYVDDFWTEREKTLTNQTDTEVITSIVNSLRKDIVTDGRHKPAEFFPFLFRTICDYIASMTDSFAIKEYQKLYDGNL